METLSANLSWVRAQTSYLSFPLSQTAQLRGKRIFSQELEIQNNIKRKELEPRKVVVNDYNIELFLQKVGLTKLQ